MWWRFFKSKKKPAVEDFHDLGWYELAERRFGKKEEE